MTDYPQEIIRDAAADKLPGKLQLMLQVEQPLPGDSRFLEMPTFSFAENHWLYRFLGMLVILFAIIFIVAALRPEAVGRPSLLFAGGVLGVFFGALMVLYSYENYPNGPLMRQYRCGAIFCNAGILIHIEQSATWIPREKIAEVRIVDQQCDGNDRGIYFNAEGGLVWQLPHQITPKARFYQEFVEWRKNGMLREFD